jgi:starch synthase
MALRVAFLAAECEPWAKTGGLADVVDALARALGTLDQIDRPVDVYLPRYRIVPDPDPASVLGRTDLTVPDPVSSTGVTEVTVVDVAADGYRLRLIDHPPAFDRGGLYGDDDGDFTDNAWRFGLLCRAAMTLIEAEGSRVDVLHLHDWHTGPAAIFREVPNGGRGGRPAIAPMLEDSAIVMTLHNLAYHGFAPNRALPQLGLGPRGRAPGQRRAGVDLLSAGIEAAEVVNTVSPTYASEALTRAFGMGLERRLRARGDRFIGILNGLDTTVWDPATDTDIAAPFSRDDRSGKVACRAELLERVGLDPADDGPVVGMIGRLDPQKGFDLLAGAAPDLLDRGARLIVLGSGHPSLADPFRALAQSVPGRVAFIEAFDRVLARRIYAGADFFTMPSRFEPCGQGQMIALRYGTPPIVHSTGGLADTVVDVRAEPAHGTGFVFHDPTPSALADACDRAFAFRARGGPTWDALLDRGMAVDFDWRTGAAAAYVAAYQRAVEIRRDLVR